MRQQLQYILIGILFITIVYQCTETYSLNESVAAEKQKVVDAKKNIQVLNSDLKILKSERMKMSATIDKLNVEIVKSKQQTILIQKQRDEKVHSVDTIPTGQLQGFFTNRYGSGKTK